MSQATNIHVPGKTADVTSLTDDLGRLFLASLNNLQLWYERAQQRRRLAQLDERLLQDIGIDRAAAMKEVSKPFWRA